jgi:hypothetical protein
MKFHHLAATALLLAGSPALAGEACSSSTLASPTFSFARWCGDPATTGTLRVGRRDGPAAEFQGVPVDTFRELVRTHRVAQFLQTEVEPRFQRVAVPAPPRPRAEPAAPKPVRTEGRQAPRRDPARRA